jgi:hypothetical protein
LISLQPEKNDHCPVAAVTTVKSNPAWQVFPQVMRGEATVDPVPAFAAVVRAAKFNYGVSESAHRHLPIRTDGDPRGPDLATTVVTWSLPYPDTHGPLLYS